MSAHVDFSAGGVSKDRVGSVSPEHVKDLDDAEKAIAKESMVAGKMRGQGEKTIFEDTLNI